MSKKKKTVTAPLSYDPGKGRPKEYLAYLNWQEMQALQRLNGGNMERGPMGLPSFPPDWKGPSGGGTSSGNWQGAPSTAAGSTSGGGSDSGSRGSATSSAPNAAAAAAASKLQASDSAAQQAAETKNAATAAKNSALTQDAKKGGIASINVGPMQTPVKIGSGSISRAVASAAPPASVPSGFMTPQQQMADRMNTMYSPKALGGLYKGVGAYGISDPEKRSAIQGSLLGQTIELSRMGKTVGYTPAPKVRYSGYTDPTTADVVTHWTGSPKTKVPALGIGKGYGYGVVVDPAGNVSYTKQFNPEGNYPQTWHTSGYNTGRIGVANIGIEPNPAQIASTAALGRDWFNPEASVTSHGYLAGDIAAQRRAAGQKFSGRPSREGKALASAFSGGLSDAVPSPMDSIAGVSPISGTVKPNVVISPASIDLQEAERSYNPSVVPDPLAAMAIAGLTKIPQLIGNFEIPTIPEQNALVKMMPDAAKVAYANKMAADFAEKIPGALTAGLGALDRMVNRPVQTAAKPYQDRLITAGGTTTSVGPENFQRMDPVDREQIDRVQQAQTYDPDFMGPLGGVSKPQIAERDDYVLRDEAQVYPKYVTPETQQIVEDQERTNRRGLGVIKRGMPFFGGIVSGIEKLQEQFTDQDIADYGTAQKYRYMQASPEEQAAMRQKYPDVRRFAVSIGQIPPNVGTQYAGGVPTQEPGGKGNDLGSPSSGNYPTSYGGPYSTASAVEEGRPSQYYLWDLGVGVPSPGDPEYNDYQEYLKDRRTTS